MAGPDSSRKVCQAHSGMEARLLNTEVDTKSQWAMINKIMDRPPVWTTVVIWLLAFLLGSVATYAGLSIKLASLRTQSRAQTEQLGQTTMAVK